MAAEALVSHPAPPVEVTTGIPGVTPGASLADTHSVSEVSAIDFLVPDADSDDRGDDDSDYEGLPSLSRRMQLPPAQNGNDREALREEIARVSAVASADDINMEK
eukprot:13249102-Ditylum_brightwellii.AAC.1